MEPMNVIVYNDGQEVFRGPLSQFLADNENDEWLASECAKLETDVRVEFSDFHSGDWVIVKQ